MSSEVEDQLRKCQHMNLKNRRNAWIPTRKLKYFIVFVIIFIIHFTGLSRHLWTRDFDDFTWPIEDVDVPLEVEHALKTGATNTKRYLHDWNKTTFIILPQCPPELEETPYELLIIVKSRVDHANVRSSIRSTWAQDTQMMDFRIRTVFVVGKFRSPQEQLSMFIAVEREAELHKDLLVADIEDTYENNIEKFIHSIKYAHASDCQRPDFVLLIDDDYMLSVHSLITLLNGRSPGKDLYEGWMFDSSPFRFSLHKHAVSLEDYPFNRYPPYITAGAVLLSQTALDKFYYAIPLVKRYHFDDVYAGIVAHQLNIKPRHNSALVFWHRIIPHDEWTNGEVIACHGYSPAMLEEHFPIVRYTVAG